MNGVPYKPTRAPHDNRLHSCAGAVPETPRWLADSLRQLRPLVETGYENVLLARLIMEQVMSNQRAHVGDEPWLSHARTYTRLVQYLQASGSAPKLSVKELESKWPGSLRSALLHRYGVTAQDLVDVSLLLGVERPTFVGMHVGGLIGRRNKAHRDRPPC